MVTGMADQWGVTRETGWGDVAQGFTIGANKCPPFSQWTVTGGSPTYDSTTGIYTLPDNSTIASPLMYCAPWVDFNVGCDFWTDGVSSEPSFQPDGAMLQTSSYFKADRVTAAFNDSGAPGPWTTNGNAQRTVLNTWVRKFWTFDVGNEVVYFRWAISNDTFFVGGLLKVKDPDTYFWTGTPTWSETHQEYTETPVDRVKESSWTSSYED